MLLIEARRECFVLSSRESPFCYLSLSSAIEIYEFSNQASSRLLPSLFETWRVCHRSDDGLQADARVFSCCVVRAACSNQAENRRLTEQPYGRPAISPDSKYIACAYGPAIVVIPFEGGEPIKRFSLPRNATTNNGVAWSPDGSAMLYCDLTQGLWRQPLDGRKPEKLPGFRPEKIFYFAFSRDGQRLAVTYGTATTAVALISGQRQQTAHRESSDPTVSPDLAAINLCHLQQPFAQLRCERVAFITPGPVAFFNRRRVHPRA